MAFSSSAELGVAPSAVSAVSEQATPGVQNPHWSAKLSRIAAWTGLKVPSASARPSIVVTSAPSA